MQRAGFNGVSGIIPNGVRPTPEGPPGPEQTLLQHQPAHRFEKATGLKGIAAYYKYPGGINAVEFDDAWTWTFSGHGGTKALPTALVAMGVPMPEVGLHEEINAYLKRAPKEVQGALRNVWDELVTLNPELKAVRVDKADIGMVYDAINGAASGFNANDINYYFKADKSDEARRAYFQDPRRVKIEEETGARPCWIASPETLDQICLKLEERTARAAAIRRTSCAPD